jgi:hypothetical protein
MARGNDLTPPIDAGVEFETITFDFGPELTPGTTITAVAGVTCSLHSGTDATPTARIIGAAQIAESPTNGAASTAVLQLVGGMVAGAKYKLQVVVNTSDGQTLSLWTRISCIQPD